MSSVKPPNKLEHDVQNEIRLWCGEHDILAIRHNVGKFRALNNPDRIVDAGPPPGWPDLELIDNNGHSIYCECKTKGGRLRDDQKKVHAVLRARGKIVIVPKSLEEFIKEISKYEWFK